LSANALPLEPNDENVEHLTEQQILTNGDAQMIAAIHYLEMHQTSSTGPAQGESLQQQTSVAKQLALEPAFFPTEA